MRGNDHQFKNGHFELPPSVLHAGTPREPVGGFASEADMVANAEQREAARLRRIHSATIFVEKLGRPQNSFGGMPGGTGTGMP